jgi:hypothetical protein
MQFKSAQKALFHCNVNAFELRKKLDLYPKIKEEEHLQRPQHASIMGDRR